ncbi:MAG: TIGR03435 family protein [Vicinamibacterales bacterium]
MKLTNERMKTLIDRQVASPSDFEMAVSRERILNRLRATPPRLQQTPLPDAAARASWWRSGVSIAAAAAIAVSIVFWGSAFRPQASAVVEAADSSLYRLADGGRTQIRVGDHIRAEETVRSNGASTVLGLADGSRVEMGSEAQLSWKREPDGLKIHLDAGSIIVSATKASSDRLYVQTKDMTVSVAGTTSLVKAAEDGSGVGVIEGEARVREGVSETKLRPGQQVSTSLTHAARPLAEEVAWSRNADAHLRLLAAFAKGIGETAGLLQPVNSAVRPVAAKGKPAVSQFEEASVKQCDPDNLPPLPPGARGGGANSFYMSPGRTYALCMTLATIIRTAYNYGPYALVNSDRIGPASRGLPMGLVYGAGEEDGRRVRGGPDWIREERYTIEAVADGASDAETMSGPMLRALLEKRFQLKAHVEMEDVPAFDLTVARGGLKIKAVDTSACEAFQPGVGLVPRTFKEVRNGQKPSCGLAPETNGPNLVMVSGAAPLATLASALGAPFSLGARVIDKTGIADRFNFVFEFVDLRERLRPETTADVPRAANVFTAIEEQLGLRLVPSKASRPFVVVDHVERPGPN